MIWAIAWYIQSGMNKPMVVHADSTLALLLATLATGKPELRKLATVLRSLVLMVQQKARPIFAHVKAHSGQPWNELADAVAAAAGMMQWGPLPPLPWPKVINNCAFVEWL